MRKQVVLDYFSSIVQIVSERRVGLSNFVGKAIGSALLPYVSRTMSIDYFEYLWRTVWDNNYDCDYIYKYENIIAISNVDNIISTVNIDSNDSIITGNDTDSIIMSNDTDQTIRNISKTKKPVRDIEYTSLEILDSSFLDYLDSPIELQPVCHLITINAYYYHPHILDVDQ